MPSLDSCINDVYQGIPASSGEPPVIPVLPSILDPENYDPEVITYSLDHSKFYNAFYFLMGFA